MLRARNLGALVHAAGGPDPPPVASTSEVILHFDLLPAGQEGVGDGGKGAACHAEVGWDNAGRLLVRRRVARNGRTDIAVQWIPEGWDTEHGEGSDASVPSWQPVTPAQLRDMLAPLGLQVDAVDRWAGGRSF